MSNFSSRHIGINKDQKKEMLNSLGINSIDELISETIPKNIRINTGLKLDEALTENEYLNHIKNLAKKNKNYKSFIGLGYNESIIPSVIKRNILENPSWYTAYTPYQAEIAQGRMEALLNYQTIVCDLTGMELSNASLLDESTSAAEAMTMLFSCRSREQKKENKNKFFVSDETLSQTISLLQTRSEPLGIEVVVGKIDEFEFSDEFYGCIMQYPGIHGNIIDIEKYAIKAKSNDIKIVIAADILALCILKKPSEFDADVVVGTSQRFGIPLGYGGPHAAFFATKEKYKRSIPGRIIGLSKDVDGDPALRMALQTREQHIKRDRATSNICTSQVLLAVMASMYGVFHGPNGLKKIASKIHELTVLLENSLKKIGIKQLNKNYFDTLFCEGPSKKIRILAEKNKMNFNYIDENHFSISINEATSLNDIKSIVGVISKSIDKDTVLINHSTEEIKISVNLRRKSKFLQTKIFNTHHSETSLMRYIKSLERKDLSLTHSMISLGSCTMKLNAASEMIPISWSKWNNIHPFVPLTQAKGYQKLIKKLEEQLNEITGFSGTSLQPNSGAQGEYAGLMVIRAYLKSISQNHRNICLIPSSAHGTNPASAVMAGMKVIVIGTDKHGNINVDEFKEKAKIHKDNLAALMVTYPSTHGVFESSIQELTDIIHNYGGQVYMDGANMNAQVGLTNPSIIGADVCHLNLHKTFAIPHGGGGPGVGPICVAKHLVPFLPNNPVINVSSKESVKSISGAPWGSALACVISYGYICMLGAKGLKSSTEYAILNANYIKFRIEKYYNVLYKGESGRAAHELIIDCRPFKENGIGVMDIAKRLIDYGFHAPTVSFPVPGTMMIEPTESENLDEIDRFCDAMIAIRTEINQCSADDKNNLLCNAPHTLKMISNEKWDYPYSRKDAVFPSPFVIENKFWPSVRRVDDAYGDRNLVCTCYPIDSYIEY
ncbi:MAG: glycine dehydrogenase (aminomethyl-transferring) [Flavobacteriaceae bacterium]|nr:glycine dehydrogenase (aminomethyl-transferring) [Flavobacteriaceae bacterium]|tara:strand:- start:1693 stop:4536 length:2844 start_codon:yes stop_codon:yes gene_type:complete